MAQDISEVLFTCACCGTQASIWPAALMSDETRPAVQKLRDMLAAGINIQATGEATNAVVTGIIETALAHIDELEADLNAAVAIGRMTSRRSDQMRAALQFAIDGYARVDVNHEDYRVEVYKVALDAVGQGVGK